ncbi:MAG: translation initiation factor IF-2, partial [Gammaproteobacteria bacterium]|nr:translation initiation factor IF-2 [Gammaproteobacteria bacterium]
MGDLTVAQYADVLKVPVEKLLDELEQAGISVSGAEDVIGDKAKQDLLVHLRKRGSQALSKGNGQTSNGATTAPREITLKRRSQSELKLSGAQGRARTVNIEVRKKRTYMKRDVLEAEARKQRDALEEQRQKEVAEKAAREEEITKARDQRQA